MKSTLRQKNIIDLINQSGFITVKRLSQLCDVSEMTIRRDLEKLDHQKLIKRTYGGATPLLDQNDTAEQTNLPLAQSKEMLSLEKMDVIIASSVNPYFDNLLVNRTTKKGIPIIAESIELPNQKTIVAVDNYQAGYDLGVWAREYLDTKDVKNIFLLDLTFHQPNTLERSRGFTDGIKCFGTVCETVLSINAGSRYSSAYQIAQDALTVYPQINLIFAINDITALGAINACRDMGVDPEQMTIITFGLEGDTLINELMTPNSYCKAGLAMFPEISSRLCIQEAIAAYQHLPQQKRNVIPHTILTAENLSEYYSKTEDGWKLKWETAFKNLNIPKPLGNQSGFQEKNLPMQIGLIIPFSEHEWYKNLTRFLKEQARQQKIVLQIIDADQSVRDEVELRRKHIARKAASNVKPGEVIIIDSGPISRYLAEALKGKKGITVITNSIEAFETLNRTQGIVLILTGGAVRSSTQALVGPTAELALKELRADKLFLMVSGITLGFGLSHHTISEVTIKQAMINSAREVILVADHTAFMADVGIQVAPLETVNRLIVDDALPPSTRLNLSKSGIQIVIA